MGADGVMIDAAVAAEARQALLFFGHDATYAAGRLGRVQGKRRFEPVIS